MLVLVDGGNGIAGDSGGPVPPPMRPPSVATPPKAPPRKGCEAALRESDLARSLVNAGHLIGCAISGREYRASRARNSPAQRSAGVPAPLRTRCGAMSSSASFHGKAPRSGAAESGSEFRLHIKRQFASDENMHEMPIEWA